MYLKGSSLHPEGCGSLWDAKGSSNPVLTLPWRVQMLSKVLQREVVQRNFCCSRLFLKWKGHFEAFHQVCTSAPSLFGVLQRHLESFTLYVCPCPLSHIPSPLYLATNKQKILIMFRFCILEIGNCIDCVGFLFLKE